MSEHAAALLDAAYQVQLWQQQFPPSMHWRATHYLALRLKCDPTWESIEAAIVRLELEHDAAPMKRAA